MQSTCIYWLSTYTRVRFTGFATELVSHCHPDSLIRLLLLAVHEVGRICCHNIFFFVFFGFSIVPLSGLRGEVGESRGRERRKKQEEAGERRVREVGMGKAGEGKKEGRGGVCSLASAPRFASGHCRHKSLT